MSDTVGKIALCAIGRMENNYIREWVEHYKSIGFDHIYLYDNNLPEGEHFEDVIGDYIEDEYVTLIDVRSETSCQCISYNNCYKKYGYLYEYMAFFDIDEFLMIDTSNIHEAMRRYQDFDAVCVCWKMFDDNNLIKVINGDYSLVKRFTHPQENNIFHIKTIYKTGLSISVTAHSTKYPLNFCNSQGIKTLINGCKFINKEHNTLEHMCLNHYRQKTIEEFVLNRMVKGDGVKIGTQNKHEEWFTIDYFFKFNTFTKEKEDYALKLLQTNKPKDE